MAKSSISPRKTLKRLFFSKSTADLQESGEKQESKFHTLFKLREKKKDKRNQFSPKYSRISLWTVKVVVVLTLSTTESSYNGHVSFRTGPWKKVAWSDESRFLLHHLDSRVCVHRLPGEEMAPGCTMGRRQAGGGSVMLYAMFCWETSGPGLHVDVTLTRTTYQNIVADRVTPLHGNGIP
ncbi:hypothetical protein PGIGA_G00050990 [Pangasianodon gigas]|uniref:Uncharacterized protein n=1 Tax=Pangasianodon gigas TaxID=30993 RepID=A0ACC5X2J2_PANGG|nr:hypothetical protein [Pangasianodon gigas]